MLQDKLESLLFISTYSFIWWNEICSSKIGLISISRILFAVESDQRKSNLSSTDHLVLLLTGIVISSNCSRIRFLMKRHDKNVMTFC